jgi:hypothetical protein
METALTIDLTNEVTAKLFNTAPAVIAEVQASDPTIRATIEADVFGGPVFRLTATNGETIVIDGTWCNHPDGTPYPALLVGNGVLVTVAEAVEIVRAALALPDPAPVVVPFDPAF